MAAARAERAAVVTQGVKTRSEAGDRADPEQDHPELPSHLKLLAVQA
jgi:hypothetical protein